MGDLAAKLGGYEAASDLKELAPWSQLTILILVLLEQEMGI